MNRLEKEQMEKEIERQKEKVSRIVNSYWMLATIVALFKVCGFKEKRIIKVLKIILEEVGILTCGYIGMTDYKNSLKEQYELDIDKIRAEIRGSEDEG